MSDKATTRDARGTDGRSSDARLGFESFSERHIGPRQPDVDEMLRLVGCESLDALAEATVPLSIQLAEPLALDPPRSEHELLRDLAATAERNQIYRSYIGAGYYDCITPPVIQRNILENPAWYTQYTPYQSEIAQGRLEALLNFQTMVADLTALPLANASLLDEATAAAEAMSMCWAAEQRRKHHFFVADDCHPQTIAVVRTRAEPLGIELEVAPPSQLDPEDPRWFGMLLQYPTSSGLIPDYRDLCERARRSKGRVVMATDLLALTLLTPPGELGADIAVGSTQRFGVPMGFGGPHAAFVSADVAYKRHLPGRVIGISRDAQGATAYRMALQTREQHIRRERATSNVCTAQVLLAIMASMYAVYHGPSGLRRIARRVHRLTTALACGLRRLGIATPPTFFDTLRLQLDEQEMSRLLHQAERRRINLRRFAETGCVGVSLDETTTANDVTDLWAVFANRQTIDFDVASVLERAAPGIPAANRRTSEILAHPVFNRYHSEHELLRYMNRLQARDLSLTTSMIPLGSCTMKLNATSELLPVSWPQFTKLHPFVPPSQAQGYAQLIQELGSWLAAITGLPAISMQPNAGAQGEYAGLLTIRAYHRARGESQRNVCLIPVSAHGTNPASAAMAGMKIVPINCDSDGNIDLNDLSGKAERNAHELAALMVTYPSTHGVFEEEIRKACETVHRCGGQVYLDGANLNAQVGLCRPGDMGADVCHLNLHKTFCIPHGGGGPGMGPIAAAAHLGAFLPAHPLAQTGGDRPLGTIAAAPYGSAAILPISWVYIGLMGGSGLKRATQVAILNANYMAKRLEPHYPVLFSGRNGLVAHEFILDLRELKKTTGITVDDVAKRLMDYGFHAPTMAWPVPGTMMIEPTESESRAELDRFCEAMILIREEIRQIERGVSDPLNNPLKNAPHTARYVSTDTWTHPYSRQQAAFPASWLNDYKFWPPVGRVDNAYGDRNLRCTW